VSFPFLRLCCLSLILAPGILAGCDSSPKIAREEAFGPSKVRIHPTFTQVKDWNGDGGVDGVEAVVELLDSFDEPTKASGTMLFQLSEYKPADPNPADRQLADPWRLPIETRDQQVAHWNTALRAYTFQLPRAKLDRGRTFVLDVTFETAGGVDKPGGGRLFDRLVIEPPPEVRKPGDKVKPAGGRRPGK
jgi:hypothetical protein